MRGSTKKYRSSEHYYFFPAQIWSEILSYLPIKSLLRCRSVCTTWKSIIEHPDFTFLHLKHYPKNILKSQYILLEQKIDILSISSGWSIRNNGTMDDIICKIGCPTGFSKIPGSVNGLLLFSRGSKNPRLGNLYDLILWNPSLKKHLHLPIGDTQIPHNKLYVPIYESYLGFGGGDHKVMVIIQLFRRSYPLSLFSVEIFSLNTRSWHKLEAPETNGGFHCMLNRENSQVTLGGSIYWIGELDGSQSNRDKNHDPFELVNFDVSSESFSYTKLPKDVVSAAQDNSDKVIKAIVVSGSYLGILGLSPFGEESNSIIWILTESSPLSSSIGNKNSGAWTKWCEINLDTSLTLDRISFFCPRLLFMEKTKVPEKNSERVGLYDLNTQESKMIALSGGSSLLYIDTYIESLLLL